MNESARLGPSASPRRRSSARTTSARAASPPRASAPTTTRSRTAETLNRLGKESVEAGVGPVYIHNHTRRVRRQVRRQRRPEVRVADPHGAHRRRATCRPRSTSSGPRTRSTTSPARPRAALVNAVPDPREDDAHQGRHQHRRPAAARPTAAPARRARPAPASSTSGRSSRRPRNKVQYYHHEHDGGTITDADTSFTNLKGDRPVDRSAPCSACRRTSRPSPPAPPAAENAVDVTITNTGDAPLTITANCDRQHGSAARDAGDFSIVSSTCANATLRRRRRRAPTPAVPRGTCIVNVGFKPTRRTTAPSPCCGSPRTPTTRPSRSCLTGTSNGDALGGVGGDVPSSLPLTLGATRQLRRVHAGRRPQLRHGRRARRSSAPPATRPSSVTDPSTTATGHLVNGTFSLPSAAAGPRGQRRQPEPGLRAAERDGRHAAQPAQLRRPDRGRGHRHDRLPPGDRRHRHAARRQLQQDADVHAVDDHSVDLRRGPHRGRRPCGRRPRAISRSRCASCCCIAVLARAARRLRRRQASGRHADADRHRDRPPPRHEDPDLAGYSQGVKDYYGEVHNEPTGDERRRHRGGVPPAAQARRGRPRRDDHADRHQHRHPHEGHGDRRRDRTGDYTAVDLELENTGHHRLRGAAARRPP